MFSGLLMQQSFPWLVAFYLVFFRLIAFTMVIPIVTTKRIPRKVMVLASMVFALVLAERLQGTITVEPETYTLSLIVLDGLRNAVVGFVYGAVLLLAFEIVKLASTLIAFAIQLGFAQMVDPSSGGNNSVVTNLMFIVVSLVFIASGGLQFFVEIISLSFATYPLLGLTVTSADFKALVDTFAQVMAISVTVALPFMACGLLLNLGLALVAKVAPAFNLFSIGFPLCIVLGVVILGYSIGYVVSDLYHAFMFLVKEFMVELS